ncbi:MAG: DUF4430 domain-containing protein [Clostridia bacterium]|nr:DUF4430 domain-containing protein [Clostridia bacterium]
MFKKRKDIIIILAFVMIAAIFILNTDFKSVDEYYLEHAQDVENADATVFISIKCETILENIEDLDRNLILLVPKDGIILPQTEYALRDGDSVFDILVRTAKTHKIQMEYSGGASSSAYIEGIAHFYEFSCGELSGWTYLVNGEHPSVSSASYELSDGDVIEWVYTCEVSRDILQGGAANE